MQAKGRAKVRDAVRKGMGKREGGEATSEGVTTTGKPSPYGALRNGERLTGCPNRNRWQASTGEWCRLASDDIVGLPIGKPSSCFNTYWPERRPFGVISSSGHVIGEAVEQDRAE